MQRNEIIQEIEKNPDIDVLIIGAGINGAGTFRDLALNGVNVLLVDREDFCSGTSATSSHMAHGGIRYLENGEFRLVREAVAERNRMIENAPHLVQPLPTVIPIFKIFSGLLNAPLKFLNLLDRPSERGALVIKIGLMFYDSFTRKQKTVPRHSFFNRATALSRYPALNNKIKYAALYYDGQLLSPERMTVEIILDGEDEGPHAKALNYVSFVSIENGIANLMDELTGKRYKVNPKIIINAAGPWIDIVNERIGFSDQYIGGTKGSHLVIKNKELRDAVGVSEFFFENNDGRIVLLLPFFENVIVGTSDLPIGNPDDAKCTIEEENYFLHLIKRVFPTIDVKKEDIVFRFSGVRPLEYMNAKTTGQITRDHSIKNDIVDGKTILSLVGGKWTSFRAFSEQVTDMTLGLLNRTRLASTASLPIRGGKNYPVERELFYSKLSQKTGLDINYCALLFKRYGAYAENVADYVVKRNGIQLKSLQGWTDAEIRFLVEVEKPVHLDDLFLRRSTIGWMGLINPENVNEIANIMGDSRNWSKEQIYKEIQHVGKVFLEKHSVKI